MSALARLMRTEGRGAATVFVWLLQGILAWSLAAAFAGALSEPLTTHPAGVFALYGEDGRLLADFLRVQSSALNLAGAVAIVVLALWAVAGVLLGGFVPVIAGARLAIPTVPAALAESLRRAPSLVALSLLAGIGYGLVGLLAWFAWKYVDRASAVVLNARTSDLRHALVVAVVLALLGVVRAWHGVARFHAMTRRARALAAAADALGRLAREPLRTLGRGLAWVALASAGTALAFAAGAVWDRHRALWAVALLTVIQQLSLLWRAHCRMRWYAGLSRDEE